jgi:hypothetical protein
MKKIIFLFSVLCTFKASAQVMTDNNSNKFIGTWQWTSGTDTLKIVLEKQIYTIPASGVSSENLVGWHPYIKNGILKQSSLQYVGRDINLDFKHT